jgi:3-deoxy-7-phosphoheptulonate synthase
MSDDVLGGTWRRLPVVQQPDWPDPEAAHQVVRDLASREPLVTVDDTDRLRRELAAVAHGQAFLVQGGDCAELFAEAGSEAVDRTVGVLSGMAGVLTTALGIPVVTVGRFAGQYAKPRSNSHEERGGVVLPVYRGDAVNGARFTREDRTPDPRRLARAYDASAATLARVRTLRASCYTSHEGLLLDYEAALLRRSPDGRVHAGSTHLLWIGDRTRQAGGAHVEFARRIANPVAVKLGPTATPGDVRTLLELLDPDGEPGRLTFVTRLGADRVRDLLPPLAEAADRPVGWVCDPMHGNGRITADGRKTRAVDDVLAEIDGFFAVHRESGTHPGGLHLELTGDDVTECVGGGVVEANLGRRYTTACDPRLNATQALGLANAVAARFGAVPA